MNLIQKIVLLTYSGIIALMLTFPPTQIVSYDEKLQVGQGHSFSHKQFITRRSGGFTFIGNLGGFGISPQPVVVSISMDFAQISIQIIGMSLMAGAFFVVFGYRKPV